MDQKLKLSRRQRYRKWIVSVYDINLKEISVMYFVEGQKNFVEKFVQDLYRTSNSEEFEIHRETHTGDQWFSWMNQHVSSFGYAHRVSQY